MKARAANVVCLCPAAAKKLAVSWNLKALVASHICDEGTMLFMHKKSISMALKFAAIGAELACYICNIGSDDFK